MFVKTILIALSAFSLGVTAQAQTPPPPAHPPVQPPTQQGPHSEAQGPTDGALTTGAKAKADLASKSGSKVTGTVQFSESGLGMKIDYNITGLTKDKSYGFHIHEKGDCSAPDAKSAGKHYMVVATTGGTSSDNPQKYAGDLPSVIGDASGNAKGTFTVQNLTVNKKNPVTNRAIILHDGPDDVTKKSAARIACGVIK